MSTPAPYEVPSDAAYVAARDRLLRTTDALVGVEGQVVDLTRRLDAALARIRELQVRVDRFEEEARDPDPEIGEEVIEDGESTDPVGYVAAVGQAD